MGNTDTLPILVSVIPTFRLKFLLLVIIGVTFRWTGLLDCVHHIVQEATPTLSLLSIYAKIKTEVYESSFLGELYGKFSSILGSDINRFFI